LGNEEQREGAKKVVLAEWVSKALGRALTYENIQSGFHATAYRDLSFEFTCNGFKNGTLYNVHRCKGRH
jgi:hypothetical protein